MAEEDTRTRRYNEHLKLLSGTANAIALGVFALVVLKPLLDDDLTFRDLNWVQVAVGVAFHGAAHYVISLTK